jgi:hypothetical protein
MRQDMTGPEKVFREDNYLSYNRHKPDSKLFSRLSDLEKFRGRDGKLHLKLCYPKLGSNSILDPPCVEWKQLSNPFSVSTKH